MGHRIEEALKKLDREGRIDLRCLYFGSRVHDRFTVNDPSNSDAPIPHAIGLLFYDYANSAFATHVSGQKGTTIFMIQH